MTGNPSNSQKPQNSQKPKALTARRVTLLATVAALGGAMLIAGPGGYRPSSLAWTSAASAATTDSATQHPAGFADLVAKVKPAVISVRVKIDAAGDPQLMKEMQQNSDQEPIPFEPGSPMYKFFQQFGQQFGSQGMPHFQPHHEFITGEGSGFFISPDGYAVTNNHVVDHAKSVQVTTDDGTIYTAKVVGTDPKTDLAVIKVDGKKDFPYVKFADHSPRVGDWVVAVGNPFGLGGTVTAGIVSARGRDIGAGPYDDYIQIDAPINKGNSGGPAFNEEGEVIGVNTAIYSPSGGSVGIGFDIPADTAKMVVAQLEKSGHVTRGWLGVQIQPVTAGIADGLGMKKAVGALVDEPQAGSPAAKAGIEFRRRHHCGQRHAGEGCPRARPHDRHDGAERHGQARHRSQGPRQDPVVDAWRDAERAHGESRHRAGAADRRRAASRPFGGARHGSVRCRWKGRRSHCGRSGRACRRAWLAGGQRHPRRRRQSCRQCRRCT